MRLCLKVAETMAQTGDDWGQIALEYSEFIKTFDRDLGSEALRCMRGAEALAVTSIDWLGCATYWFFLPESGTRPQVFRCLGTALAKAETSRDFAMMAINCVLFYSNLAAAEAMMQEAEKRAVTYDDWEAVREVYTLGYDADGRAKLAEDPPYLAFEVIDGRVVDTGPIHGAS